MAQIKHLFIVCGEPSGDLHAGSLAAEILKLSPSIKLSGVGGEQLKRTGAEIFCDIKELSALGFFDVLKKLPRFFSLKKLILDKIEQEKPDAIILVDFSGFNLRLARAINKRMPVIYYVSPQVWASRQGRVETIKRFVSRMIVLFKFEEEFYKARGMEVDFAGHPLLEQVKPTMSKKDFLSGLKLDETKKTIALLPGSRMQEIKNILPLMLKAAKLLKEKAPGLQFLIAKSTALDWELYSRMVKARGVEVKVAEGKTADCLNIADLSLVASGTATLEATIMQKPFFVVYKMGLLNYLLYLPQVRIPYIGMSNIIMGRKIVPEFIQFSATPEKIAAQALLLLNDPAKLDEIKRDLSTATSLLGEKGAAKRAAEAVLKFLKN